MAHCGGLRCAPRARAVGQSLQTPGTMAGSYLSLRAMGGTVEVGLPGRQGLPCALSKDLLTDDVHCAEGQLLGDLAPEQGDGAG